MLETLCLFEKQSVLLLLWVPLRGLKALGGVNFFQYTDLVSNFFNTKAVREGMYKATALDLIVEIPLCSCSVIDIAFVNPVKSAKLGVVSGEYNLVFSWMNGYAVICKGLRRVEIENKDKLISLKGYDLIFSHQHGQVSGMRIYVMLHC